MVGFPKKAKRIPSTAGFLSVIEGNREQKTIVDVAIVRQPHNTNPLERLVLNSLWGCKTNFYK